MKTKDNHEVEAGDTVWVWSEQEGESFQHTIKTAFDLKIEYTEECPRTGYIGARFNLVYKNKPARIKAIVHRLEEQMQCNCNLDSWQPEQFTGHSWVCRIHKAAIERNKKWTA
jgi:hypothetical protein